jgi:hypothetical protein
VPSDRLRQEKAEYKVTFGELYLAHQFAKAANLDFKTLITDVKKTSWGMVAMDRKFDKDQIREMTKSLEKALKSAKK